MAIQNEKFGFTVRDNTTGAPLSGALVELRKGATIYTLTEVSTSGFYEIASIPTGKYSVFINSVDSNSTMAVGSGQVAALGNETDNIAVSTSTEFAFQDPTEYKTTLSLENVTNVAVPSPVVADANKVVSVDSTGAYELRTISTSGFDTIFEVTSTASLREALEAEYDAKLIVINREDFNFVNTQSFEVWGSCSIMYGNTFEPFKWDSQSVNISFSYKAGADVALTGMMFLNGITAFEALADYTLNIPWKVTNLTFIGSDTFRSIGGTGNLIYEYVDVAIPASVTVTTTQDWWQNSVKGGGTQDLDSVLTEGSLTGDNVIQLEETTKTFDTDGMLGLVSGEARFHGFGRPFKLFGTQATGSTETNFNNYTDDGLFLTPNSGLTNQPTGYPSDKRYHVQVINTPAIVTQLSWNVEDAALGNDIARAWNRSSRDNGATWTSWEEDVKVGQPIGIKSGQTLPSDWALNRGSDGDVYTSDSGGTKKITGYYNEVFGSTSLNNHYLGSIQVTNISSCTPIPSALSSNSNPAIVTTTRNSMTGAYDGIQEIQVLDGTDKLFRRYVLNASWGSWFEVITADSSGDVVIPNKLNANNLPTSSAGLSSGDVWNDSGILKIV